MSNTPPSPSVLSRLYLSAVLPCLTDLAHQDSTAREIIGDLQASIVLAIVGGPAVTLHLNRGEVIWQNGMGSARSVILLFLSDRHLNAFFSGKKWALPLAVWGAWRIGVLARFAKLAARLDAVLNGAPTILATEAGRRLHARLSLIAAGLGLRALAQGDEAARAILLSLPPGLAAFSIAGDQGATIWFDHGSADCDAGWGEPPRRPDVRITFADMRVAYGAMREEIDTLAAVGSGQITVEGLVPLADGLNFVMERLRIYLQPASP
jgi:hypothetical protein